MFDVKLETTYLMVKVEQLKRFTEKNNQLLINNKLADYSKKYKEFFSEEFIIFLTGRVILQDKEMGRWFKLYANRDAIV